MLLKNYFLFHFPISRVIAGIRKKKKKERDMWEAICCTNYNRAIQSETDIITTCGLAVGFVKSTSGIFFVTKIILYLFLTGVETIYHFFFFFTNWHMHTHTQIHTYTHTQKGNKYIYINEVEERLFIEASFSNALYVLVSCKTKLQLSNARITTSFTSSPGNSLIMRVLSSLLSQPSKWVVSLPFLFDHSLRK